MEFGAKMIDYAMGRSISSYLPSMILEHSMPKTHLLAC